MNKERKDPIRRGHILTYLNKGVRYDGRKMDEYREIQIIDDVVKTAEGSARIKIGTTDVIAGVKFELGKPYPDIPDQGTMSVNVELLPLSSPDFESGPPSEFAVEMARVVDRGIRESKAIDTKKLCVTPGELVWTVMIDICPVNTAGNLLDAMGIAAIRALQNARFPEMKDGAIDYKKLTKTKLPLEKVPVPVTIYKTGKHLLVDPILEEEDAYDARLTVTTTADGKICAYQKGGDSTLMPEEVITMTELALKKSKEIRKLMK